MLSLRTRIQKFSHQTFLETAWTVIPVAIILFIAIPSFILLYAVDVTVDAALTIKAIAKQWFWNYELEFPFYSVKSGQVSFQRRIFDSYMLTADDLLLGQLRNLEVDNFLMIPLKTHIDVIVTSDDVLHSFALPSLGVKVDAVPGRLNHVGIFVERPGIFYGQCSELCGTNHAFMPIQAMCLPYDMYTMLNKF